MADTEEDNYCLAEGIRDICNRMRPPPHVPVLRDLLAHQKKWGLEKVESILSIGPGAGDNDVEVLPAFPKCRHYIGVEKDKHNAGILQETFARYYPELTADIHTEDIGQFKGPTEPVDAIFAFNVLNEIENVLELLPKLIDWMKPGGVLLILHGNEKNNWALPVVNKLYPAPIEAAYLHGNLKKDLLTLNQLKLTDEFHYEHAIDFRQKTKQLGWWFLHRSGTDKEVDDIHEAFHALDESLVFTCGQSLGVCVKNGRGVRGGGIAARVKSLFIKS